MAAETSAGASGAPTARSRGDRLLDAATHPAAAVAGMWLSLAALAAALTYRIADWWKVPDELVFQRLALSIGRDHSLVPRIHGVAIRSLNQLYPLLIAPIVRSGYVVDDLPQIRLLNAIVYTSACIPAYLLARRVTGRAWAGFLLGVLSVALPWFVLTPFLLTEVVALPAFLWAVLALQHALVRPSARADVTALAAIALAVLARTQLVLLAGVLPLALLAFAVPRGPGPPVRKRAVAAGRAVLAGHRVLVAVYAVGALAAVVFALAGGRLLSLSIYGEQFGRGFSPAGVPGWMLGHLADLAFTLALLPFLVGTAWLLANVVRPAATPELQAFACVAAAALLLGTYEATVFDLQLGGFIFDRYLFYVVPLVLLAFCCALLDERLPRWSLVLPAAAVAAGFLLHFQQPFTWGSGRVNSDAPPAVLYRPLVDLVGGRGTAAPVLAAAAVVLAAAFAAAGSLLPRRPLAVALLVAVAVALPAETGYVFHRLFAGGGYFERPLTRSNAGILDWVDRAVGTGPVVTMAPYPVSSAFLVTQNYWRDLEFWNKSIARHDVLPDTAHFSYTGYWFAKRPLVFDERTGAVASSPTRYAVQSVGESRFRIGGTVIRQTPEAMLVDAGPRWRLAWCTRGLAGDGWTLPSTPAVVRVYGFGETAGARLRSLSLLLRAPEDVAHRRVVVASGPDRRTLDVTPDGVTAAGLKVCVPAGGHADVRIGADGASPIPGPQTTLAESLVPRRGGVLVAQVAVADEVGAPCLP